MRKITVVGAGNVGATVANVLAQKDIVKEIVLLDIQGDLARGKALDSWQQSPIEYYSTRITGTEDYKETAGSDIVVITAEIGRASCRERGKSAGGVGGVGAKRKKRGGT